MARRPGKPRGPIDPGAHVREFVGAVPSAVQGHLNVEELARIRWTALLAAVGILGLLQALVLAVGTIFPAPTDAALAGLILTFILESRRRLGHGREPDSTGPAGRRGSGGNPARGNRF
jgi:hypothetical protein